MKSTTKRILVLFILLAPLAWGLLWKYSTVSYHKVPIMGEIEMNGDTTPYVIPDFSFIDQNGDSISQKDFDGKIYVANFFFATCPDVCPIMNRNLHLVYEKFKRDSNVRFISHTVHPEHDTVEVLLNYANKLKVNHSIWHFVTGRKAAIYALAEESYKAVAVEGDKPANFIHSPRLVLVDKEKHIRGFYDSHDFKEIQKLEDDIIIVLKQYHDKR